MKYLGVKGKLSEVHDAPDMTNATQLTAQWTHIVNTFVLLSTPKNRKYLLEEITYHDD